MNQFASGTTVDNGGVESELNHPAAPGRGISKIRSLLGAEVLRMVRTNAEPASIKAHLEASTIPFSPTPEEIIALRERGVPADIIAAMILHGAELAEQAEVEAAWDDLDDTEEEAEFEDWGYSAFAFVAPPASHPYAWFDYVYPWPLFLGAYPACADGSHHGKPHHGHHHPPASYAFRPRYGDHFGIREPFNLPGFGNRSFAAEVKNPAPSIPKLSGRYSGLPEGQSVSSPAHSTGGPQTVEASSSNGGHGRRSS